MIKRNNKTEKIKAIILCISVISIVGGSILSYEKINKNNWQSRIIEPSEERLTEGMTKATGIVDSVDDVGINVNINGELKKVDLMGVAIPVDIENQAIDYLNNELVGEKVDIYYYAEEYGPQVREVGKFLVLMYIKNQLMGGSLIMKGLGIALSVNQYKNNPEAQELFYSMENEAKVNGNGIWEDFNEKAEIQVRNIFGDATLAGSDIFTTATDSLKSSLTEVKDTIPNIINDFKK